MTLPKINLYNSCGNNSLFARNVPVGHTLKKIGEEKIQLRTLDDFISGESALKPDIVKIDVEGAELNVLKGSLKTLNQNKPFLLIEYSESCSNDAGYNAIEIIDLLKSNYYIYGIAEDVTNSLIKRINEPYNVFGISNIIAVPIHQHNRFILSFREHIKKNEL